MDPPVSHILASQIQSVNVIEGPYDVENFGVLSGGLTIKTKQPTKEEKVEINLGFGSFDYKKFGLSASGGNDSVRFLVTGSLQNSGQYEDGEGNTLAMQTKLKAPIINQYKPQYFDMDAYDKRSLMTKLFITTATNQELRLGYTANRSSDVMYANTSMDAMSDDSNIYNIAYNIKNISDTYKNLNLQYYYSDVQHPMSTLNRELNTTIMPMTSELTTSMQGIKVKNDFEIANSNLTLGLDHSRRTWNGIYYLTTSGVFKGHSINNAITKNNALFAELSKDFSDLHVKVGARYDDSEVKAIAEQTRDFSSLSANILATYNLNSENKIFAGIGKSSRIPDARELYFYATNALSPLGTPTLNQTTNKEIDLGYETDNDMFKLKIKGFYSKLDNYIYFRKTSATNVFENIDATVYGAELSGSIYAGDYTTIDFGASYKRGKKDDTSTWTTDNLADIAPLRANIAVNYEYANNSLATLEMKASDRWDNIDAENGEQILSGWAILNAKMKHAVSKNFDLTIGMNNIFDKTYAMSNTYADLTLLSVNGTTDVMLLNEPGRYFYTNLDFRF